MKIHVLSLGCARTLVDSEGLGGLLNQAGHTLMDQADEADCVVVNTCAFISDAETESISIILDLAQLKRTGKIKRLYVAGCLPQKRRAEQKDLLKELPEVDGFIGPGDLPKLPELIKEQEISSEETVPDRFFVTSPVPTLLFESSTPKYRLTPKHFAYLKISEGCDHACAFCSIPQYRGAHRSRTLEDLVKEAQSLAAAGVVELILIGQDTSYYGMDLAGRLMLPELLEVLGAVEGIRWIRLLYAHPAHVTNELVQAIAETPNVVKYIDIPLQHINDQLLKQMKRETDGARIRQIIRQFRDQIPGVAIRTTFIVGFPGETEVQARELEAFLEEAQFERVGIFPYSPEPKTPAEKMSNNIPETQARARMDRLMKIQQKISRAHNQKLLGQELEVLIDEPSEEPGVFLGRTAADAPEVDGQVFVRSDQKLKAGQFVKVLVAEALEYDLMANTEEETFSPGSGHKPISGAQLQQLRKPRLRQAERS